MTDEGRERNEAFYGEVRPGVLDYWRKMAAPRFRVATLVDEIARLRPASMIDLGCGNGQLCDEIHGRFPQMKIAGVDLSEAQIAANRVRLPWGTWYVGHLSDALDLDGARFDLVTATELIEHLDRPDALLANARRLLAPGGALILTTQSGKVQETERRVGHLQHFTTEKMASMLREAGFSSSRVWNAGYPFHDLSKWYANRDPDKSMSQFGEKAYGLKEDLVCAALRLAFRFNSRSRGAQLFAVATA